MLIYYADIDIINKILNYTINIIIVSVQSFNRIYDDLHFMITIINLLVKRNEYISRHKEPHEMHAQRVIATTVETFCAHEN